MERLMSGLVAPEVLAEEIDAYAASLTADLRARLAEAKAALDTMTAEHNAKCVDWQIVDAERARLAEVERAFSELIDEAENVVGYESDGTATFQPAFRYAHGLDEAVKVAKVVLAGGPARAPGDKDPT